MLEPLDVERTGCLYLGPTSFIASCGGNILTSCGGSCGSVLMGATGLHQSSMKVTQAAEAVRAVGEMVGESSKVESMKACFQNT